LVEEISKKLTKVAGVAENDWVWAERGAEQRAGSVTEISLNVEWLYYRSRLTHILVYRLPTRVLSLFGNQPFPLRVVHAVSARRRVYIRVRVAVTWRGVCAGILLHVRDRGTGGHDGVRAYQPSSVTNGRLQL